MQKKGVAAASPIHPSRVVDSENAEIILTPREEGEGGNQPTDEAQGWMGTREEGRWLEGRGEEGRGPSALSI